MITVKELFSNIKRRAYLFLHRLKKMFFLQENKVIAYIILALFTGLIIILLLFILLGHLGRSNKEDFSSNSDPMIEKRSDYRPSQELIKEGIASEDTFYAQPQGELSNLIQKANILYNNGRIDEALELFKRISLYSQSLASYNLGVIRLEEKRYTDAIAMFKQGIETGDDVALSAINAAYSSFKNQNQKDFNDFLKLADLSLPDSAQAPFYSYLYGLVSYYKNQYFEALSPLLHPNSKDYLNQSHALASEMFLILGDDYNALKQLQKDTSSENRLALGLLYARNGDYANAKKILQDYLAQNPKDWEALSALELVELKMQHYGEGASILSTLDGEHKQPFFKIKVGLSAQLFDINEAQKNFWNRKFEHRQSLQYKILFHYAPYKVFDAKRAFRSFSEGELDYVVGNIDEAADFYIRGENISKINQDIVEGLREIYLGDLRKGLQMFLKNAKDYFQHSALYYNIGLVYAQLGDFENAYRYFSKAYYLNHQDLLSGIFAILTGKMTYQDTSRIAAMISGDFVNLEFPSEDERIFLNELFVYAKGEKLSNLAPIDQMQNPIHLAFVAVSAMEEADFPKIRKYFAKLKERFPNDLSTSIMDQVAQNYGKNLKEISLNFSAFFREGSFSNMHSLYYGGSLCRDLYIQVAFITGNLAYVITHLQNKLTTEESSPIGTLQALGLAYIYNQEFEKAFSVYNNLVDRFKEQDSRTKFLGAVSAIGAGHYNNAVALLQISKLDSAASLESRYALALLYQQNGNLKSAITLLQSIDHKGFISEFFDFSVDTSEILKEAQR